MMYLSQIVIVYLIILQTFGDNIDNNFPQYPETSILLNKYDFIIVGGGSAGCALANRLSEMENWNILLIEAGGEENKKRMDIPAFSQSNLNTSFDWNYVSEPLIGAGLSFINKTIYVPRGKVLGGSSVINNMKYNRGAPAEYDRWENVYKNSGWGFNNIEKYFRKLEDYTIDDSNLPNYFGKNGPLHVECATFRSKLYSAFFNASQEAGLKSTSLNGPNQIGVECTPTTIKDGYRFSSNRAYLVPIRRKNLHLKLHCQVIKILFNGTVAIGVDFVCSNQNYTIYTNKEVILSAGAINSPQLLMLSGIGPKSHLAEQGIPLLKDLPVGKNLMDHVVVLGLQFLINQSAYIEENGVKQPPFPTNQTGSWATYPGEIQIFSHPSEGIQLNEEYLLTEAYMQNTCDSYFLNSTACEQVFEPSSNKTAFNIIPVLIKPKSRGYILLRNNNPFSSPRIFLNYLTNSDDILRLLIGIRESQKIAQQPSLKPFGTILHKNKLTTCEKYDYDSDDYWICQIRHLSTTLYHQSGTCKMGPKNYSNSVVDAELRVHGINRLRVIDASIMPEIIGAHINGPTIMIAEKGADMIKEYWNYENK